MYARVFEIAQNDPRPEINFNVMAKGNRTGFDGTGLLSAQFYMVPINADGTLGTPKVNGANATIVQVNPLILSYVWTGTDTDTLGRYASYMKGYWGAANTLPQTFDGPEILIYAAGTKLVH